MFHSKLNPWAGFRGTAIGLVVAVSVAGCKPTPIEPTRTGPIASTPPESAPAAPSTSPLEILTPDGSGPLKIGMSLPEAMKTGLIDGTSGTPTEEYDCVEYQLKPDPDVAVMIRSGRLSRITISEGSTLRTASDIGVGATEAQVKAAYGPNVRIEPHHYDGPESHYLTIWTRPGTRGLRFETKPDGTVYAIHAGDESILFVEGCL